MRLPERVRQREIDAASEIIEHLVGEGQGDQFVGIADHGILDAFAHGKSVVLVNAELDSLLGLATDGLSQIISLQAELVAVISKYVQISPDDIKVSLEKQDNLEVLEVKIELPE